MQLYRRIFAVTASVKKLQKRHAGEYGHGARASTSLIDMVISRRFHIRRPGAKKAPFRRPEKRSAYLSKDAAGDERDAPHPDEWPDGDRFALLLHRGTPIFSPRGSYITGGIMARRLRVKSTPSSPSFASAPALFSFSSSSTIPRPPSERETVKDAAVNITCG